MLVSPKIAQGRLIIVLVSNDLLLVADEEKL